MKKKTITKNQIMKVWGLTIDTQPHYSTMGSSHSERMIKWFELEGYNITTDSITNIEIYIKQRKEIMKELSELALNDFKTNVNGK
jgi:hypothetical protein